MQLEPAFDLACIMERDSPQDAFVSPRYAALSELPEGAVVGTSSLRREAQLRARYPKLQVRPLRGNLDTRLAKLDRGEYDAIILAAAGLRRLGLGERIRSALSVDDSLPAPGQGTLGIEIRADRDDLRRWLAPLADQQATDVSLAERAVSRGLGGSCQVPLAAHAVLDENDMVYLRALVATPDGGRVIRAERRGPRLQADALGSEIARELLENGADRILAELPAS